MLQIWAEVSVTECCEGGNFKSRQGYNYPQKNKIESKAAALYHL